MLTNYELKRRAREALRDHWPNASLVVLITLLLAMLSRMYSVVTGTDPTQQFLQFVADMMRGRSLRQALIPLLTSETSSINLLDIAFIMMVPVLSMGCAEYMLRRLRQDDSACMDTVLYHMHSFWPALKLSLLASLRMLGWMLPGFLMIGLGVGQVQGGSDAGLLVGLAGFAACIGMECWATYRYGMALYFLTEDPMLSSKECIQASVDMMAHRKMQLFSLELSFILFDLGILLVQVLLAGILGSMMAALLGIALHLPVQTYREATMAAFYLEFRPVSDQKDGKPEEEKPSILERWNHGT